MVWRTKALLLDLDGTLLDDRAATRAGLEAFLTFHARTDTGFSRDEQLSLWRSISARHWQCYETGEITFAEQRRRRVREFLGRPLSDEEADEAFEPYRDSYERSWRLLPGVAEFLVRTKHIPKAIVTNGDREQQLRKAKRIGLHEHVVGVVTPSDCGHWKPHPSIFLAAASMLRVSPNDCLMIGDDPIRDIEPAKALGMDCLLVEAGYEDRVFSALLRAPP